MWSGSCVEEAWAVVEEAERAEVAFGSKDLLDARLALVQVTSCAFDPHTNCLVFVFLTSRAPEAAMIERKLGVGFDLVTYEDFTMRVFEGGGRGGVAGAGELDRYSWVIIASYDTLCVVSFPVSSMWTIDADGSDGVRLAVAVVTSQGGV